MGVDDELVVTLSRLPMPGPWSARGRCRGAPTNVFFPTRGESAQQAKAICALCPVQPQCLEYAVPVHGLGGIWGGTTERERRRLRRGARIELENERGFEASLGSLDAALEALAAFPGHWARVAHFGCDGSAHSTASLLRTGRRRHPPGRWQFEGRVVEGGGSDLYAMLEPDVDVEGVAS